MAGINRLGKGPAKPGSFRPPDPNRNRTIDMFTEGAEGDIEYQRMVNDIEEMQQRQGWLTGRGAFDKADLLYLRDQAEIERHKELELRDNERAQFEAMRAQTEAVGSGPLLTSALPPPRKSNTAAPAAGAPGGKPGRLIKPVVKPKAASTQQPDEPAAKRLRLEAGDAGGSAAAQAGAAADKAKPAGELASLLGGYGSGSDEEDSDDDDDGSKQQLGAKKAPLLPSAAELLGAGDDKAGSEDASASAQEQSAGEAETEDGDGDGSSDDDESDDD